MSLVEEQVHQVHHKGCAKQSAAKITRGCEFDKDHQCAGSNFEGGDAEVNIEDGWTTCQEGRKDTVLQFSLKDGSGLCQSLDPSDRVDINHDFLATCVASMNTACLPLMPQCVWKIRTPDKCPSHRESMLEDSSSGSRGIRSLMGGEVRLAAEALSSAHHSFATAAVMMCALVASLMLWVVVSGRMWRRSADWRYAPDASANSVHTHQPMIGEMSPR